MNLNLRARLALTRRRLLAASVGALLVTLAFGQGAQAQDADTLRFGLSSYPPSLSPWENTGTAAATVKLQLYRGLLGYDENGELRYELAESYEQPDDKTYVFHLRPDAVFHDGSPVTAEDVKASYEAIAAEDSTAYLRSAFEAIESIEVLDEHTVEITLKEPTAPFVYFTASFHTPIIKAESIGSDNPIGAGPYTIANIERGTRIDMQAFPDFYKEGLPKTPKLSFVAYQDENLRTAALEAGDVDVIEYVPWQTMDMIDANPDLKLDVVGGPFMYVLFNAEQGPFADPLVRQAVAHAIKRDDIIAAAFFGRGEPLSGMPVPEGSAFYNAELADTWSYDPERAKELLAEAGYPEGFDATMLSTAQYGMHKDTAEVLQQQLAAVGINLQLNLPDWATRVDLGNRGQYDIAVMGSGGDYNDPDALANFLDGRRGASFTRSHGFNDEQLNELLDAGRATVDEAKRREIYDQMQQRALELAPLVGINWRAQGYATQDDVEGFKNMPGFLTFYSGSTIESTSLE